MPSLGFQWAVAARAAATATADWRIARRVVWVWALDFIGASLQFGCSMSASYQNAADSIPVVSIQASILYGLGHVLGRYLLILAQIRDRTGHLQHTVMRSRR